MVKFEIIEHTADIGMRVRAKDLKGLFRNAALAVFQISCRRQFIKDKKHKKIIITQKAESLDELFVNWLNELLSLSAVKGLIFHDIKISEIDENSLKAVAVGSSTDNYKVNTEIKAATYHGLKVEKAHSGWLAEVIFDV